ncbi:MAG: hypothetical protein KBC48_01555 [Candidatus Pacebacteria bacterium]|nr:hypothetical protein [Candidatus Paceibacterota bacterium]
MKYLLLILLFLPLPLLAITESSTGPSITASVKPDKPSPNQVVTISLNSYQLDLDRSRITWFVNGERRESAVGLKTFTVTTGPLGTPTIIKVTTVSGTQVAQKIIDLKPGQVDLLWEADTYTPPNYQGKALPTPESWVTIWARPYLTTSSGSIIPSTNLVYKWYQNGNLLSNQSGANKETLRTQLGNTFDRNEIKVLVSASDGTEALGTVDFKITTPKIIFYPLTEEGNIDYSRALPDQITFTTNTPKIAAAPFYLSRQDGEIMINWNIDGKEVGKGNVVELAGRGSEEEINVVATAENPSSVFQKALKSIKVILKPEYDIFPF